MSLVSHKGQILPLANQVIPITPNTTFHANYNEDFNGNNLFETIYPVGDRQSLRFGGAGSVTMPQLIGSTPSGVTISCWVWRVGTASGYPTVAQFGITGTNANAIGIQEYDATRLMATAKVTSGGTAFSGNANEVVFTVPIQTWIHVAITVTPTTLTYFLNGVKGSSVTGMYDLSKTMQNLYIGGVGRGSFDGHMSHVQVWTQALSQDDIAYYMIHHPKGDESNLVGYWKMNEGEGPLINDHSSLKNDGLIDGNAYWSDGIAVASIRKKEGRYGNAIAIEQGRTNVIQQPNDPTQWTISIDTAYGYVSHSFVDTEFGIKALRKTIKNVAKTDYRGTLTTIPWNTPRNMNTPYTFSIYARLISGDGNLSLDFEGKKEDGSRVDIQKSFALTTEWTRCTLTSTLASADFASINGSMKVYTNPGPVADSLSTIDIVMPQMEQSDYPTSFTATSRPDGFLQYPKDVINTEEGTISMWVYTYGASTSPSPVYSSGVDNGAGAFDFLISQSDKPYVRMINANGSVQLRPDIGMFDQWNHIVVTWKKGTFFRFYGNGILLDDQAPLEWEQDFIDRAKGFYIGSGIRNNPGILVDELRIDKIAVSESDIVSWYVGGPHYNAAY